MADNKFKSAAAKLLDQHSAKQQDKPVPEISAPVQNTAPLPEPKKPELDVIWQNERSEPPLYIVEQYITPTPASVRPSTFPYIKKLMVIVPALLGCGVMLFLVPLTILGVLGNIALGLFGGAAFGWIIAKEL